jgi:hypothetical protein
VEDKIVQRKTAVCSLECNACQPRPRPSTRLRVRKHRQEIERSELALDVKARATAPNRARSVYVSG